MFNLGLDYYAYTSLYWKYDVGPFGEAPTSSSCTSENLSVISGTGGITMVVTGYSLTSFTNFGTGDHRIYSGGTATIYNLGVPVLVLTDLVNELTVSYPAPIGTGNFVAGFGQGSINVGASNASWVSELDPFSTGLIDFTYSSVSPVAQNSIGYYDVDLVVSPVTVQRNFISAQLASGNNEDVDMSGVGLDFHFNSATFGGGGSGNDQVFGMVINEDAGGTLPPGIASINTNYFWNLGTTVQTFNCNVIFDTSLNPFPFNPATVSILRRESSSEDWTVWPDITVIDPWTIRANGVTGFSDWIIGENDVPLPVELISFSAEQFGNSVKIFWKTASEFQNNGFILERSSDSKNFKVISSYLVNPDLKGKGNSSTENSYAFTDEEVNLGNTYIYRLYDVDFDGQRTLSGEMSVTLNFGETEEKTNFRYSLDQNFPNPFNPSTTISYTLAKANNVKLEVYNTKGELIRTLVNEKQNKGSHTSNWNGKDERGNAVSSGVYFYKLVAGNFVETKKMILLK
ncbi:T9SS type A sorting domain-containing protein [bacterium]|nr:T9SS type A sorting domain-containing protein [bacterium]